MRNIIIASLLVASVSMANSPCDDPLFKDLQQQSIDSMTTRQYQYFMEKQRQCQESKEQQKAEQMIDRSYSWLIPLAIIGIAVGFLPLLFVQK